MTKAEDKNLEILDCPQFAFDGPIILEIKCLAAFSISTAFF
jgi:hypothetical protein